MNNFSCILHIRRKIIIISCSTFLATEMFCNERGRKNESDWCFPRIKLAFQTTNCISLSKCLSTEFYFLKVSRWRICGLIGLNGNLIGFFCLCICICKILHMHRFVLFHRVASAIKSFLRKFLIVVSYSVNKLRHTMLGLKPSHAAFDKSAICSDFSS